MGADLPGGTFRVEAGVRPANASMPASDRPFHAVLLGDFSGRGSNSETSSSVDISNRHPIQVDRDNVDAVLAHMAPWLELRLAGDAGHIRVSFDSIESFHPDSLYERISLFGAIRARQPEPGESSDAAGMEPELPDDGDSRGAEPAEPSAPPPDVGSLLDQVISASKPDVEGDLADRGLQDYISRIVAPHEVPRIDPRHAESLAQREEQLARRMREILHCPEFQALEALWRGVSLLCRRVETSPQLKLFLIDVSRAGLALDQAPNVPLDQTALYRLLVEAGVGTPGAIPWSLIVGCYSFGPGMEDAKLLARIGAIAKLAGAPWLAAAAPSVVGCPSFGAAPEPETWTTPTDDGWEAIRRLPYAGWLGFAMPRFLLRQPYGRDTDQCESFAFEEIAGDAPEHEDYLWGNPALLCAMLILQDVAAHGWRFRPGTSLEVSRLPLHVWRREGEFVAKPCAEVLLTERALTRIADRGVMALASLKDQDAVRLLRFQSVSSPPASLAGPWA